MKFSRRAVSPIIATLLLIAIAVAAGVLVYVYVNSLSGNLTSSNGNQVTHQSQAVTQRHPAGERPRHESDQDPDEDRVHVETDVNHFTDSLLNRRTFAVDHAALAARS